MKKEFVDFLYEKRANVQNEINELVKKEKQPREIGSEKFECPIKSEIRAKRLHIQDINLLIESYFLIHTKSI